jgi:hypothetical protein
LLAPKKTSSMSESSKPVVVLKKEVKHMSVQELKSECETNIWTDRPGKGKKELQEYVLRKRGESNEDK